MPTGEAPGALRASTAPSSARPGDEAFTLDPGDAIRLAPAGPGRATLMTDSATPDRPVPVSFAAAGPSDRQGPRLVEVIVEGWRFEVEVEPARRAILRERASRDRRAGTHGPGAEVHAIIPGRVVSVSVTPGDPVTTGQQLLVVEAMKMQNEVRAPRAGVVERLAVAAGQTIELGDLLAVIGEAP